MKLSIICLDYKLDVLLKGGRGGPDRPGHRDQGELRRGKLRRRQVQARRMQRPC